jgi:hypothetical protein
MSFLFLSLVIQIQGFKSLYDVPFARMKGFKAMFSLLYGSSFKM